MSRAPWVIDLVAAAMIIVVPVLAYSILQVRKKRNYKLHKQLQTATAITLLIAIVIFEVDIRLNGWRQYAQKSPYYDTVLFPFLAFHIVLATATTILWVYLVIAALRKFPKDPAPNSYSPTHKFWARIGAGLMFATAVTGWIFYYMAFIAG